MKDYHINVFFSEEDDCWVADIPDLQFCSAFGDTPEEAVREVMIAQELWLATARDHSDAIPQPRYQPAPLAGAPKRKAPARARGSRR